METVRRSALVDGVGPSDTGWHPLVLRVTGAGLLFACGAIHLDLYLTGYRSIPTIGVLFLLQIIVAFVLGVAVLASPSPVASAAGALFALSTLGGYLLSLWFGLFGFREVRTSAGIVAGLIEIAAFGVLAAATLVAGAERAAPATNSGRLSDRPQAGLPGAGWAVAVIPLVAVVVLAVSVATSGSATTTSSGSLLKTARINGVTVLVDARGFTLYWFVPDTPARSNCTGTCAAYWPPVTGSPAAGPGVTGRLGTIRRSDGSTQVTYDGHPLYTYVADTSPGQARGNDINLNGGLWHEMTPTG